MKLCIDSDNCDENIATSLIMLPFSGDTLWRYAGNQNECLQSVSMELVSGVVTMLTGQTR